MCVVNDPRRYQIQLTKTCWYHHILVEHPEMKERLDDIRRAIETPDCIYQSKYKSSSHLYFLKKGRGSFGAEYVLVVVTIRQRAKKDMFKRLSSLIAFQKEENYCGKSAEVFILSAE